MSRSIVIAGSIAQRAGNGGHASVFLQWLLGFKQLGWRVLLIDRLEPEMCFDAAGQPAEFFDSENVRYFLRVLEQAGLQHEFALLYDGGRECLGRSRQELIAELKSADLLLNVMGFLTDATLLATARRRVFLDIDPGFSQMWHALELHDAFAGHDQFVTIGENLGQPNCTVPCCGLDWITTPQPIVLRQWPVVQPISDFAFTSVISWRGPFGPIDYLGQTYGLRVHEFRKFVELPRLTASTFRLAIDIDHSEVNDIRLLQDNGWQLESPGQVAADPATYRQYIQQSGAELMVAKNLYVKSRGGWFSDRSLTYLASGKPVLAQDTGFRQRYPCGQGLIAFSNLSEAVAGVAEIEQNYARHCQAARQIAERYFDSDKVLTNLVTKLGLD